MAKTQAERDAAAAEKRKRLGEEELRHRVRPGTKAKLEELMRWHGIEEMAEAMQLLIMNAHAMGQVDSAVCLEIPRHEITITEDMEGRLRKKGKREAERLDRHEC